MVRCPACGAENQAGKRFCGDCGTPLVEPAAAAPATIANGRFELLRLLGEGGKKRVHLARDTHLEREVALSLIKTEGLDGIGRTRVLREAQAMGRLGANPNIVAGPATTIRSYMACNKSAFSWATTRRRSSASTSTRHPSLRPGTGPTVPRPSRRSFCACSPRTGEDAQ